MRDTDDVACVICGNICHDVPSPLQESVATATEAASLEASSLGAWRDLLAGSARRQFQGRAGCVRGAVKQEDIVVAYLAADFDEAVGLEPERPGDSDPDAIGRGLRDTDAAGIAFHAANKRRAALAAFGIVLQQVALAADANADENGDVVGRNDPRLGASKATQQD